jgi:hypothetical protein
MPVILLANKASAKASEQRRSPPTPTCGSFQIWWPATLELLKTSFALGIRIIREVTGSKCRSDQRPPLGIIYGRFPYKRRPLPIYAVEPLPDDKPVIGRDRIALFRFIDVHRHKLVQSGLGLLYQVFETLGYSKPWQHVRQRRCRPCSPKRLLGHRFRIKPVALFKRLYVFLQQAAHP